MFLRTDEIHVEQIAAARFDHSNCHFNTPELSNTFVLVNASVNIFGMLSATVPSQFVPDKLYSQSPRIEGSVQRLENTIV
jgi:hypothetical protein